MKSSHRTQTRVTVDINRPPSGGGTRGYFPRAPNLFPRKGAPYEAFKYSFYSYLSGLHLSFSYTFHCIVWTQWVNTWVKYSVTLLTHANTFFFFVYCFMVRKKRHWRVGQACCVQYNSIYIVHTVIQLTMHMNFARESFFPSVALNISEV